MRMNQRPRRLRRNPTIRNLVAETAFSTQGLIQVYFVTDGTDVSDEIPGLAGIYRESVDRLLLSLERDFKLGIRSIMLFGVTDRKDAQAGSGYDSQNPVVRAIPEIKRVFGDEMFVAADVCLCGYTDTGHCGVTVDDKIDNDASVTILTDMALALAGAGCDCVAPSDMMDGRVGAIRDALESNGFTDTLIMAYTAKYASAYYGPFREAANSAPGKGDRTGYQMDFRNRTDALRELALDEAEGADFVMVKPALAYLDIISDFAACATVPVVAYNVSGEYAAVKLLAEAGLGEEARLVRENITAIKRAGASVIITYHLRDILTNGWDNAKD